ncbi:hypothetical protein HDV05_006659 [Chytridiales sp. JEL 0842]|nr:hypothetical protein HDV05_006659 [Chytridiales sp. JEL 0842]
MSEISFDQAMHFGFVALMWDLRPPRSDLDGLPVAVETSKKGTNPGSSPIIFPFFDVISTLQTAHKCVLTRWLMTPSNPHAAITIDFKVSSLQTLLNVGIVIGVNLGNDKVTVAD